MSAALPGSPDRASRRATARLTVVACALVACGHGAPARGPGETSVIESEAAPVHATQDDLAAADHACDLVEPYACAVLGIQHEIEHHVPADDPIARRYFSRACERGEAHGCLWLAEARFVVSGGNPQAAATAEAVRAAQEGCQFGNGGACDLAGRLALAIHDESTAIRWEDEACRLGMVASCRYLIRHDVDPASDTPVDLAKLYAEACRDHVSSACQQAESSPAPPAATKPSAAKPSAPSDPRPQLPARTFAGYRITGDTVVPPDPLTRAQLAHLGSATLVGVFKVCITERGDVSLVDLYKPTGAIAYDRRLQRAIFRWKYEPYLVGGAPAAACGEVTLRYPR